MIARISTLLCMLLCGCASEVVRHESALVESAAPARFVVSAPVALRLDSGYERTIAAGTRLVEFGRIPEGRVLKPVSASFTVEGRHIHEAYPVDHAGRLVGFYLPVEKAFSPLSNPVTLSLQGDPAK